VDFKNTIIILTSNLGSNYILEGIDASGRIVPSAREAVERLLKTQFRPEFLNRLDEIVFYKPLTRDEIGKIIDLMVAQLNTRLSERQLTVSLTPAAKALIAEIGYDPVFGARPLRRSLQRRVETPISRMIIADEAPFHSHLTVDAEGEEFKITVS
jgi:ATP-dependent Clp protease ATP-binding subunit ClpB